MRRFLTLLLLIATAGLPTADDRPRDPPPTQAEINHAINAFVDAGWIPEELRAD